MARRSPRAPTEPFAAAPHALGERRAASRGRYPPAALLRHACAVARQRESGGSGCDTGTRAALRDERDRGSWTVARVRSMRGELIRVGDTTVQFLIEGSDSGGSAAVFEAGIRARGRMPAPPRHDGFPGEIYGAQGGATRTIRRPPGGGAPGGGGGTPP